MLNYKIFSCCGLVFLALALLATPAVAQTTEVHGIHTEIPAASDDHAAFMKLMRAMDIIPNADAMKERWPDVVHRLSALAENPEASRYERLRATSFLGNYQEPAAREALLRLTGDAEPRVRSLAYYILGANFLTEGDDALFAHVKQGLSDSEERVRADVVRAFAWTDHSEARQLLREIAASDDEHLQRIAERSLTRRR